MGKDNQKGGNHSEIKYTDFKDAQELVNKVLAHFKNNTFEFDDTFLDIATRLQERTLPPFELDYDKLLKFNNLNLLYPESLRMNKFASTFANRLLELPSLYKISPFIDNFDKLSALELEIDLDQKTNSDKQQVTKIINTTPKIIKSIYQDHDILKIIDPRKFEEVVAELLHSKGFQVELTKQTRDGGYDIFAITEVSGFPIEMIVECKRSKNTIGVDIVRSFCDVISQKKPNKGLLVTTSYYSINAKERKQAMGAVLDLQDRDDLLKWIVG